MRREKAPDKFSQCRKCGARIIFVRMKSGKSMPVNPNFVNFRRDGGIEALEEKIDSLREVQENMKEINKYYRKHHTLEGCDLLTEKQLQKLQGSMDQFGYDRSPYPSWALQNNLANIKRCQQRVDELKKTKEKGTSEADYGDFKVIENTEMMRIQIVFDGKPDEAIRSTLKANGFRWAPSQGAWQRQLTSNGKYALRRVIEELGAEVQAS